MAAPLEWCKITILLFFKEKILLVFHQFFPVPECKSSDTIIISSRKLAYVHVSVFNSIVVCGRVWCFVWPMNVQSRLFFCGRQPQEGSVTQKLCWWCLLIEPAVPAVRLDEGARGSRSRYGKTHVCSMSWGTNTSADKGLSKLFEHGKNCTFRVFFFKSTVFLLPLLLANGSVFEHTCVNSVKIRAAAAAKVMGVEWENFVFAELTSK